MADLISIRINGKPISIPMGASVAAAVFQAGESAFRSSVSGEPRAALCGMGICFECRLTIDGTKNCKSCQIFATEGMAIETA